MTWALSISPTSQIMMRARHVMSFEFNTITASQLVGTYVDMSLTREKKRMSSFSYIWESKFDIHSSPSTWSSLATRKWACLRLEGDCCRNGQAEYPRQPLKAWGLGAMWDDRCQAAPLDNFKPQPMIRLATVSYRSLKPNLLETAWSVIFPFVLDAFPWDLKS